MSTPREQAIAKLHRLMVSIPTQNYRVIAEAIYDNVVAPLLAEARAEALRDYATALEQNRSAAHWVGSEAFVGDIREWAASQEAQDG